MPRLKTTRPKPLRVGFDLDGVILYNPARIVRRPVTTFKHFFFPKQERRFYIPKHPVERFVWHVLHWSSFMVAPGYVHIHKLAKRGVIEPYIITARYDFLRPDFERWIKKLNVPVHFKGYYMNDKNEQPHEFKERMVKELKLDVFVEDNLNIVEHLNKSTDAHVLWIYNIFDRWEKQKHRFPTLDKAVKYIHTYAKKR